MAPSVGSVSVAPNVLIRLIQLAVREVPGVARLGGIPPTSALGATAGTGVVIRVGGEGVTADCYIVAAPNTQLLELGIAVQATVAAVISDLAGMVAREVNIYIQDVEAAYG